jgi:bifunctional DNA-binding transcriptional regulator/antitoxin component of YhaV-PrlF toxin-antitoxin module
MAIVKAHREILVNVDSKGRVVLPREARRSGLYALEVTDNDEIILRPRVAVDPREVMSRKTLAVLDESMQNLVKGKAGEPIDLSDFSDEEETIEQKTTAKQKKSRRR